MSVEPKTSIAPAGASNLTGGRLLARNTLLSIAGEAAPLALGLIAIPILVRELGVDRYGVLTLSYLVVGYLGLFDLGLGLAATQQISDALGAGDTDRIPAIFWTSMILMFALGICAAAIITGTSHWLVYSILNIPAPMRAESVGVFLVLGAVLPFVLSGSCSGGTLASFQRFDLMTAVGTATGVYSFTAPLAVLMFTHNLVWIVAILVVRQIGGMGCEPHVVSAHSSRPRRERPALADSGPAADVLRRMDHRFRNHRTADGISGPICDRFNALDCGGFLLHGSVSNREQALDIAARDGGRSFPSVFGDRADGFTSRRDPVRARQPGMPCWRCFQGCWFCFCSRGKS